VVVYNIGVFKLCLHQYAMIVGIILPPNVETVCRWQHGAFISGWRQLSRDGSRDTRIKECCLCLLAACNSMVCEFHFTFML